MQITSIAYQPLQTQEYGQATRAGVSTSATRAEDALSVHDKAQTFVDSLVLRLERQAGGEDKDSSALASSLVAALETIGDQLGEKAATAAVGLIARNVGGGDIDEKSLGDGLLDVLRFVDRTFGTGEGDRLIASFNADLNDAVNDYFDNGLMEKFYAVQPGADSLVQAAPDLVRQVQDALGVDAARTVADILEQGLEDGVNYVDFRKSLAQAKNALATGYGPGAAAVLAHAAQGALDGLAPNAPARPGLLLDTAV